MRDLHGRLVRLERETKGPEGGLTILLTYVDTRTGQTRDGERYEFDEAAPRPRTIDEPERVCRVTELSADEITRYLATHETEPAWSPLSALRDDG